MENIKKAADYISQKLNNINCSTAVILGSGLSDLADEAVDSIIIPYSDIPGFPVPTVPGHKGRLVCGKISGKPVIFMQGRFHYYEGHSPETVALPIRVLKTLGITELIVTNAAGGINLSFAPGDLMLIDDHINLTGVNPLLGKQPDGVENRFVDMTHAYDEKLKEAAYKAADKCKVNIKSGVYVGLTGPSYETPAEIRYLRNIGGDAVGMSTVLEVIAARQASMRVLGISLITNYGAGIKDTPLSHTEVTQASNKIRPRFAELLRETIGLI